ncbi:MAG: hypothetical protein L0Y72_06195 [Gemmataceae bacterium]|nr:hypothetical protein [Gemmataceae bacterium]MCI0738617.1 hypothetical protein [Gemmataceae bacterium]
MAGYSGTPLVRKLGIKEGHRLAILLAPPEFDDVLGALPADVTVVRTLRGKEAFDVILYFTKSRARLEKDFDCLRERMLPHCGFWVSWPKKSSGVATDLTEDIIREIALTNGLVDNKVCAVDDTWSGLRLVIRVKDR